MNATFETYKELIEKRLELMASIYWAEHKACSNNNYMSLPRTFVNFKVEEVDNMGTCLTLKGEVVKSDLYKLDGLLRTENRLAILSHLDEGYWVYNIETIREAELFERKEIDKVGREIIQAIEQWETAQSIKNAMSK